MTSISPDPYPARGRDRRLLALCALGATLGLGASNVDSTVQPKLLGTFQKWSAYAVESPKGKQCFVYVEPAQQKGNYKTRGQVSITISHRAADKVRSEVSISAGYTFEKGSDVEAVIDGKKRFVLFVDEGTAWAPDPDTDLELRKALVSGSKLVVKGRSSKGTSTTDTYSLAGSKSALDRIDRECPARSKS